MKIKEIIREKKSEILHAWFDGVIGSYPSDSRKFFKQKDAQFTNPVGHTIYKEVEAILDEFIKGADPETVAPHLDGIVRMRAVQDFSPAQAINFLFLLKPAIRNALRNELKETEVLEQLAATESEIDDMALMAFNIYVSCREKLYQLRVDEVRSKTQRLLERAGVLYSFKTEEPGEEGTN